MLWLHNLSGQLIPEAALELLPLGDQEAMKSHILALPASAKWSVMFSHWLGTASAAAVAMILAPVSLDWIKSKPTWLATLPGSVMGLFFLIGGIANATSIPMPAWMLITDLAGYFPMGFLAARVMLKAWKA